MNNWNVMHDAPPPQLSVEYPDADYNDELYQNVVTLREELSSFKTCLQSVKKSNYMTMEIRVLEKCLDYFLIFRNEKFYGYMKKVKKCAKRCKFQHIGDYIERLLREMPESPEKFRSLNLPTRQMFEYLLKKTYGAFQLLVVLDTTCQEAALCLMAKMTYGHIYTPGMIFLSIASRLRSLALFFAREFASSYDMIFPILPYIKGSSGITWMWQKSVSLLDEFRSHSDTVGSIADRKSVRECLLAGDSILEDTQRSSVLEIFEEDPLKVHHEYMIPKQQVSTLNNFDKDLGDDFKSNDICHKIQNNTMSQKRKDDLLGLLNIIEKEYCQVGQLTNDVLHPKSTFESEDDEAVPGGSVSEDDLGETMKDQEENNPELCTKIHTKNGRMFDDRATHQKLLMIQGQTNVVVDFKDKKKHKVCDDNINVKMPSAGQKKCVNKKEKKRGKMCDKGITKQVLSVLQEGTCVDDGVQEKSMTLDANKKKDRVANGIEKKKKSNECYGINYEMNITKHLPLMVEKETGVEDSIMKKKKKSRLFYDIEKNKSYESGIKKKKINSACDAKKKKSMGKKKKGSSAQLVKLDKLAIGDGSKRKTKRVKVCNDTITEQLVLVKKKLPVVKDSTKKKKRKLSSLGQDDDTKVDSKKRKKKSDVHCVGALYNSCH